MDDNKTLYLEVEKRLNDTFVFLNVMKAKQNAVPDILLNQIQNSNDTLIKKISEWRFFLILNSKWENKLILEEDKFEKQT